MASQDLPSQDVLKQLLVYEPDTGKLFWRARGAEWFNQTPARTAEHASKIWNLRYAGQPALAFINSSGYPGGNLLDRSVLAHRVIWKMVTGQEPQQVDHISGVRSENKWANLRSVCQSINQRNARRRRDNKTGLAGVYWYPYGRKTGKWLVVICNRHVGYFDTFEAAVAARKQAERELGFHENHGRAA